MKSIKGYRSAVTGKFVTRKYAVAHPRTTEHEIIKRLAMQIAKARSMS